MLTLSTIEALPFPNSSIDMIYTDPPYLKKHLSCYEWLASEAFRVLKPGGFALAMCGDLYINKIFRYFDDAGLTYFALLGERLKPPYPMIWLNRTMANTRHIIAYSKGIGNLRVGGMLTSFTGNGAMKEYHRWGQDVGCARYYIDHFSKEGDIILDPFIGGGTTAVAAKLINRRYIGCDIDPAAFAATRDHLTGDRAPMRNLPLFEHLTKG